jgi:ABC-type spermidine/putrescine transport system permease subunit I
VSVARRARPTGADERAVGERRWLWPSFAAPGVVWLILLFLTPLYAVLAVAMGGLDPIFQLAVPVWNPAQWDPGVFGDVARELVTGSLRDTMLRTIGYVFVASLVSLVIGYPIAYFVSRHAGRRKILYLGLILAPFWIPYLMRMLAWVNLLDTAGWINDILTFTGIVGEPINWLGGRSETVILGLVYGYAPFLILPLFAALDRIDKSVIEAARDLGASPFKAFVRVTLPLSKHGILAGVAIIMLPMFGDYYTPELLSGSPRTRMIGNEIQLNLQNGPTEPFGAALTAVLMSVVGLLMIYYLVSVARAQKEVRR